MMDEYEIADVVRNGDGEIEQFLVIWDERGPETLRGTPENLLLFDPDDELPFDGGLQDFLSGDTALKVSDEPRVLIAQSGEEYSYLLSVQGDIIETTPSQAEDVLDALYHALLGKTEPIRSLHTRIMREEIRRDLMKVAKMAFERRHRIDIAPNGWLIDGFYLVDWNANMYVANDSDTDYARSVSTVVEADKDYEFIRFNRGVSGYGGSSLTIDGERYDFTEREMLFLTKVKWLLDRRHYHPDLPFWKYSDQWADVDAETGMPESERPDLDTFEI